MYSYEHPVNVLVGSTQCSRKPLDILIILTVTRSKIDTGGCDEVISLSASELRTLVANSGEIFYA